MSKSFQINAYLNHWLDAVDEHSIHSPFFFDFYNEVIKQDEPDVAAFAAIEKVRLKLLTDQTEVTIHDLGAKSPHFKNDKRALSQVAQTSLSTAAYCRLYNRIIHYIDAKQILELGTSMGITTLYLAQKSNARVTTFEGSVSMINVALTHFEYFNAQNIELIEGNIDSTLSDYLLNGTKINFVLMDANHRYDATMRYFHLISKRISEKGIIVLDDIHYSKEMGRAWKELSRHQLVYGSVDLFRCGILFFDPALNRQHYTWVL